MYISHPNYGQAIKTEQETCKKYLAGLPSGGALVSVWSADDAYRLGTKSWRVSSSTTTVPPGKCLSHHFRIRVLRIGSCVCGAKILFTGIEHATYNIYISYLLVSHIDNSGPSRQCPSINNSTNWSNHHQLDGWIDGAYTLIPSIFCITG